ncbi:hypothetical protein NADFUDRAFT_53541 [Nadsonia fulvescens var. elongata DSM 6958]|uniref:BZIP domain-containing protein n=1 Tax=Nadsonia fulvescens var. elongata DSM 6958 TaxID=857566 RepID=A0A1E3PD04_9ASCO|nr:hypothetical protein NADFUDRAFT_53541 [Nadsonia fulvescens var. elongata DSM 6958]
MTPPVTKPSPGPSTPQSIQPIASRPPIVSRIAMKPSSNAQNTTQNLGLHDGPSSQIGPSKTWVLPPRPKPGRKPSVEAPPSKRKAQNRDAQRAFRERRAARVSELEEKIIQIENARDEYITSLKGQINLLRKENAILQNALDDSRREAAEMKDNKIHSLSSNSNTNYNSGYNTKSRNSSLVMRQTEPLSPYSYASAPSPFINQGYATTTSSVSSKYMSSGNSYAGDSSYDILDRVLEERLPVAKRNSPISSEGKLTDTPCLVCTTKECLCDTLGVKHEVLNEIISAIPLKGNPKKRGLEITKSESMEIDFTTAFSSKKKRAANSKSSEKSKSSSTPVSTPSFSSSSYQEFSLTETVRERLGSSDFASGGNVDPCGFCSDGTPCVCREAAAQESQSFRDIENNTLPPLLMPLSPPVSMGSPSGVASYTGDSALSFVVKKNNHKLPTLHLDNDINGRMNRTHAASETSSTSQQLPPPPVDGCSGNPGNCNQCRADPMSTLFCTTIASRTANESSQNTRVVATDAVSLIPKASSSCCGGSKSSGGCCKDKPSRPQFETTNNSTMFRSSVSLTSMSSIGGGVMTESNYRRSSGSSQMRSYSTTSSARDEPLTGTYIPCAAAYQTLSRHKDFNRVDLGTLVGKLTTRGMQVEVSSVANVLRELDRRLYQ